MESGAREGIEQRRLLLAELIGRGVIEYAFYLQRMIARGETETRGTKVSRNLSHLLVEQKKKKRLTKTDELFFSIG